MLKKIDLQGLDELKRKIGAMITRGNNTTPLMREISGIMYDEVDQNFAAQGRPKWQDLAPSTKKRYAKKGYILEPTLNRSSAGLFHSIQEFVTAKSAAVGTNKAHAAIHQFGGIIVRHPFSSTVRLRTDAKGNLLRQPGSKNLAVFAKASHKRAETKNFSSQGWRIKMPARPFLSVSDEGIAKIEQASARFITGA